MKKKQRIRFNDTIKPMLAVRSKPFDSDDYIFEIKWDGTRCIAFLNKKKTKLQNRRLKDITFRYPELKDINKIVDCSVILDGEIVVLHKGKPNFNLLQLREQIDDPNLIRLRARLYPAVYVVFDVLYFKGKDITQKPLIERKKYLKRLKHHPNVIISEYIEGEGKKFFSIVKRKGFEGVMAKHKRSPYEPGKRSVYWKKIKAVNTVDAVICGYKVGKRPVASFLLALYDKKKLRYIGKVGTGFDRNTIEFILHILNQHIIKKPNLMGFEESEKNIIWVKPTVVCEVEYLKVTKNYMLRAPVFKGLRYDKKPRECTIGQLKSGK